MAPKGTKRGTGNDSAAAKPMQPVAKRVRPNPNLVGVEEGLKQAEDLPRETLNMLIAGLSKCVGVPVGERHEIQTRIVAMAGEVLQGVEKQLREAADAKVSNVHQIEHARGELESKVAEAEAVAVDATKLVEARKSTLAELTASMRSSEVALSEAQEAQRSGDLLFKQAEQGKLEMETCLQTDFTAAVTDEHYKTMLPVLNRLGLESSLFSALPSACAKSPDLRGSFDVMVIDQLRMCLQEKLADLVRTLEAGVSAKADRAAGVESAERTLVDAKDSQQKACDEENSAMAGEQDARRAVASVKEDLSALDPAYKEAGIVRDAKREELENFQAYNLGCFELLRDSSTLVSMGGA